MNMKVAGTLGQYQKNKSNTSAKKSGSVGQDKNALETTSQLSEVWDKSLFEGLTAKQKKNLRKKLQRQRKKQEKFDNSQIQSSATSDILEKSGLNDSINQDDKEIDDINIDIGESNT